MRHDLAPHAPDRLRAALEAAEAALRESQRQYREIFELASIGIFRSTPDGQIVLANEALAAMLGYDTPDELRFLDLGRDVYLHGEERRALVARYAHSDRPWTVEVQWKKRDGTPLWVQISAHATRDAAARPRYFEAFVQDVTERRANETRLRAIIDAEPECVKLLDAEGRLLTMNPAGLAMVEADSIEQVAGERVVAVVAPAYREAFADLTSRVFAGETGTLEYEIIGLRGTRRWLETHAVPLRDPQGRITALLGITRDTTSRRRAEHALRESEERLQLVSRATNDAVWDWDLRTDALWWGEGFQTLFGYRPEEIEPGIESWLTRVHPDDRERVLAGVRAVIAGGGTFWSDEYRFLRRDGSYAEIYDRGYVIHTAEGSAARMVGSMMDVTERKRAEAQLRGFAARLDAVREAERTRIAREIHDQLGQTLTALKMDLAWLGQKLPARSAALHAKLQGMEGVIDATMDAMHRIVAELRPGVLDDLGLPAAIRWLAADFQQRTGIRCEVRATGAEPSLETGQATAVFRILQETLTNIARHAGARRVDIRFHVIPNALELVVSDDGRGITPDEAQNRRTLGILGIRERALTWHGQVAVSGEPGRGTTVRVFMPVP